MIVIKTLDDVPACTFTCQGWTNFRDESVAIMESEIRSGRVVLIGNDPLLGRRDKWASRNPKRLVAMNSRRRGFSVRTVWSVDPAAEEVTRRK